MFHLKKEDFLPEVKGIITVSDRCARAIHPFFVWHPDHYNWWRNLCSQLAAKKLHLKRRLSCLISMILL
jgi:hypothetical protein